jgi:hypothetical protein
MEREHRRQWLDLKVEAIQQLRADYPQPGCRRELQVISRPSFLPWVSLALHPREKKEVAKKAMLVRATWRRDIDLEKFRDPVTRLKYPAVLSPTIQFATSEVDDSFAKSSLDFLGALRLPLYTRDESISLDGTMYEVALGSYLATTTFRFHEDCPPQWQELKDWVSRWIADLDDKSRSWIAIAPSPTAAD